MEGGLKSIYYYEIVETLNMMVRNWNGGKSHSETLKNVVNKAHCKSGFLSDAIGHRKLLSS